MSGAGTTAMGTELYEGRDDASQADPPEHEPSMEEILASIRRIISDDPASPIASRPPVQPLRARQDAGSPASSSPLRASLRALADASPPDLGRSAASEDDRPVHQTGVFRSRYPAREDGPPDGKAPPPATDRSPAWAEAKVPPVETFDPVADDRSPSPPPGLAERIEDPVRNHAPATVPSQPAERFDPLVSAETSASITSAFNALAATMVVQNLPSVEDLARDMLRPMLKSWLDDNLPTIVERLVRAEIERVARGAR